MQCKGGSVYREWRVVMGGTCDILCIGLIAVDLLVQPVDKGIFDVDTTRIDEIKVLPGGDAMNESIILARLGQKVGLLGKVGDDRFGQMVLQQAAENGVDISNVKVDGSTITSTSIVLIDKNGNRNFVYCAGNNEVFKLEDINLELVSKAKIVNVGSILGLSALDKGGVELIFKEAETHNVITAADVSHDISKLGLEGIRGILKYTDFFIPSLTEARYLTNEDDPDKIADVFIQCGVKTVVIKLGNRGCYLKNLKESCLLPAWNAKTIDTTGAGDNFVAGFLTGISEGWDLKKCGLFANAVGALSTQEVGANSAVRNMNQVMDFMSSSKHQ
jgi:sugar/nucleoside kinase (ribokinase family)